MKKITVLKWLKFSLPYLYRRWKNKKMFVWEVVFTDSCRYHLNPKNEQDDWNKLCGIKYWFFSPRYNTAMIGWRYNPKTDRIEFCAYYHIDGSTEFTDTLMSAEIGKPCRFNLHIHSHNYEWVLQSEDENFVVNKKMFFHTKKVCWNIFHWFGGTLPAPQNVTINLLMFFAR